MKESDTHSSLLTTAQRIRELTLCGFNQQPRAKSCKEHGCLGIDGHGYIAKPASSFMTQNIFSQGSSASLQLLEHMHAQLMATNAQQIHPGRDVHERVDPRENGDGER
mmetsp:Transcript_8246/g.18004  ORF Transcript_8246/g.18004 Transcript_8246/m.18004 type:complete len:108 (+) Transcript_8246:414-737(+)|eukprot:6194560-Pleurochrysis_carterae.AAC.2